MAETTFLSDEREASGPAIDWAEWLENPKEDWYGPLDLGLDQLSLGRALIVEALVENKKDFAQANNYLDKAVESLRQAGTQDQLPSGFLARADVRRLGGELDRAEEDLKKVISIALPCGMELHLADCHLGYARLHLANDQKEKAAQSLAAARNKIQDLGYHRRDKEIADLEQFF